ncbi:protein kinase [Serratia liquefaciens]|uniref:protein kinase domain-containing protein n=1 Tax=Serratia liquefaciens TaxID=614 RepID=UPI0010DCF850|nr:protein kinase [Serratia liquefaciens]MBI6161174.1 protein kinase [Serratia liquefaciens]RYM71931.1 protein kinase [Serratia liquefaciens]RYM81588.1 protein kinase [Serratia liquefaciens]
MIKKVSFHDLDENLKDILLESALGKEGKIISKTCGMCGRIYIFDRGASTFPRYSCVKIPIKSDKFSEKDINSRFVNEIKNQLKYYHHQYVHWVCDFNEVMGVPVAKFRYWGSDLRKLIDGPVTSAINRLSIMAYLCAGLRYCYSRGLLSHQDLKPENIFLRNMHDDFRDLPIQDVYIFPLVGDFGLANAFIDSDVFSGARPYMAPEQWLNNELSPKTDIFALGIILFELMSNGYHPVGIKLSEHWPMPSENSSTKWKGEKSWRKWSTRSGLINQALEVNISDDILALIKRMLSLSPEMRPEIDEVIEVVLNTIKNMDSESYRLVSYYINYYDSQTSKDTLEERWPSLFNRWLRFQEKFG